MTDEINRRKFLKVLGVTGGGTAALAGCSTDQVERLIPYLVPNEDQIPGIATYYASTCRECSAGCGVHLRVREGRAVKVEGNPDHPINRGRLCGRAQASLQGTYNPDRVRQPLARNADGQFEPITWDDALGRIAQAVDGANPDNVWFVTGNEGGSFDRFVDEWLAALGSSHRVVFEPFAHEALRHAARQVFGVDAVPSYSLADTEYVLSFGADFLETWISPVEHTRGFAASHGFNEGMGRYVHVEPRMSMTAMSADEWIAPAPGTEGLLALAMAQVILAEGLGRFPADARRLENALASYTPNAVAARTEVPAERIRRIAREFAGVSSVALPGGAGTQHPDAHLTAAASLLLNYVAGNVGTTVVFGADQNVAGGSTYTSLRTFQETAAAVAPDVLFIHGANPAYATPAAGAAFAAAQQNAALTVSFSRFTDETTAAADLILPDHDAFEQWNDYVPRVGVRSLQQPVMQPVFDTRQTGDVLLEVARRAEGPLAQRFAPATDGATYKDYLQNQWRRVQRDLGDRRPFDEFWRESLQRGGVWGEFPRRTVRLAASAGTFTAPGWSTPEGKFTLIAYPSMSLLDGRGANRPWLQELPDPVTKMTWGSWVEINPETADRLGIAEGEEIEVASPDGRIRAPAYLHPGLRSDVVAVPFGQGHTAFGQYAADRGANVYRVLSAQPTEFGGVSHYAAVTIERTGAHERLAKTEGMRQQLGRGIAQAVTLAAMQEGEVAPFKVAHAAEPPEREEHILEEVAEMQREATQYGPYAYEQEHWAMAIDLSKCTGCGACVVACSAENNVPHVGEDLVRGGREMQWIRIERYFEGGEDGEPLESLESRFVPMLCQQCRNAPCEPVCPVYATYHTPDGLNAQVYNRCVGVRYCSNNCPYKVRYFNWFDYSTLKDPRTFAWPEPMHWLLNPDVVVRPKGIMEKCTFCVQRIRGAQNQAKLSGTPLRDGDVVVACQQTCPADAIVFGDANDPDSRVSSLVGDERGYQVLDGLNTKPAVTYLMRVRNLVEG